MEPAMPMKETVDLRSVFVTLWRRRWVVIVPAVLAAATAWVVTLPKLMKPVYQSQCTLKVEFPQRLSPGLQQLVQNPEIGEMISRLNSQVQDNAFLLNLARITGLRDDPGFGEWATRSASRYPDLDRESLIDLKVSDWLRDRIRLGSASRRSVTENIFTISVLDFDPGRARTLVQNIASGIIEANKSEQTRQAQSTGDFSATQLEEYQRRLRIAEAALQEYQQRTAARSATPTLVTVSSAAAAENLRDRAALDLEELERSMGRQAASLRQAGQDPARLERVLEERAVATLLGEARALEESYVRQSLLDAASGRSTSQGGAINLARKLESVHQAARAALPAGTAAEPAGAYLDFVVGRNLARHRVSLYDRHLGDYRQRAGGVPGTDLELQRLQSEVDQYRQLQNAFVMQMASSQISEAFGASVIGNKISLLEPAQYPLRPIRPKRTQIIILSVLAGFALGIGGVFLLEHHDPSFKDVRDIERGLRLRVLGAVPNMPGFARFGRAGRRGGGTDDRGAAGQQAIREFLDASPGLQEFRKVVLALMHGEGSNPRTIMVTSSRRGEGKSTTSVCLAHALARELSDERVLLVDLDTRRPSLSAYAAASGASEGRVVLSRQEWQGNPLQTLVLPNLRVLIPEVESKGTDQVTLPSVRWLLERLRTEADRIVIDSPPNLPVPDALIIGPEVDTVLLVIKAGETPRETARRGLELQRQFRDNVTGVLLNNSAEVLPYYYTYSHYGYGHAKRG